MSIELVSGWVDGDSVYLVERKDETTTQIRRVPAKWTAFFHALEDEDRRELQRLKEVKALQQDGAYTRVDFRFRWDRRRICEEIASTQRGKSASTGLIGTQILEADVNPLRRLLSDSPHFVISSRPRLGWFDIETDSRKRFSEAIEGKARVLSWALVDHQGNEHFAVLQADTDAAEKKLLEQFFEAAHDCDVLLAWSGDGFDFPVIEKRAAKLRIMPHGRHPFMNRWCWLDHLEVFKKYNMHSHESGEEKASFKLDAVATHLLGEGKDPFDSSRTWEAWEAGGAERERMLRYNIKDARLLPRIEEKSGYVSLHLAVCHITRCFPDSNSLMASQQGDGFLLSLGAKHGYRWPTKKENKYPEQYEGAFVMPPTRLGAIDDVHVADFASLYPSIMRSWNMSPDTLIYPKETAPAEGATSLSFEGAQARFRLDRRGLLPLALDELVMKRGEYTAKMKEAVPGSPDFEHYKRLSSAFKIVANSFYGIVGSGFTRFFSRSVAEGVTKTGAWLIKRVAAEAKATGLDPFYGDTDSIFVAGDRDTFAGVVDRLNGTWEDVLHSFGCRECHIDLDFEKSFRRLVLKSAKCYAASFSVYKGKVVDADMRPEVKGLEYKRGDSLRLAREMQGELIEMLLCDGPIPQAEEVKRWVEDWRDRVLLGPLRLEDVVVSQSVKELGDYKIRYTSKACTGKRGKKRCGYDFGHTDVEGEGDEKCPKCGTQRKLAAPPIHARVAAILAERGEDVREGTRIEYLVVASDGDRLEGVPARDPGVLERIDRGYYWGDRIYPPTARVLKVTYPSEIWVETPAAKQRREKAERTASRAVDDLPLFAELSNQ